MGYSAFANILLSSEIMSKFALISRKFTIAFCVCETLTHGSYAWLA
ncbi:hypothetical protein SL1157_3088 [Ruegeria lacuscaerulensis ITI-1157]|nr:hypothetical protein SL1157_3088 [Ruegeria lacuscaerulensis ITI-1157]